MKRIECDVLVVGAGAAGSVAALKAAKEGLKTVLIEKTSKIGGHCQTKIDVTESTGVEEIFEELKLPVLAKSNVSKWFSPNEEYTYTSKVKDLFVKRGDSKDCLEVTATKAAENLGCQVITSAKIEVEQKDGIIKKVKCQSTGKTYEINPRFVIAADGSASKIKQKIGKNSERKYELIGYGFTYEKLELTPNQTYVFFDAELAPGGYVYAANTKNIGCIGIMVETKNNTNPRTLLKTFIKSKKILEQTAKTSEIRNSFAGKAKIGSLNPPIGNTFFTGEAAGLIDPLFGYGVRHAVISGYNASKAIAKNKKPREDYIESLNTLTTECSENIRARSFFSKLDNNDFDTVIQAINKQAKKFDPERAITNPLTNLTFYLDILKTNSKIYIKAVKAASGLK